MSHTEDIAWSIALVLVLAVMRMVYLGDAPTMPERISDWIDARILRRKARRDFPRARVRRGR